MVSCVNKVDVTAKMVSLVAMVNVSRHQLTPNIVGDVTKPAKQERRVRTALAPQKVRPVTRRPPRSVAGSVWTQRRTLHTVARVAKAVRKAGPVLPDVVRVQRD